MPTYVKDYSPHKEPLIPTDLPDYPWQKIGTDLFFMNGANYLLAVDYVSRYFETIKLKSTSSASIIKELKSFFLDMVSLRPSSVTVDHNMPPKSLLHSHHRITSNTSQAAHCFCRAMDRQSVSFKQPTDCLRILNILICLSCTLLTWCNLSLTQLLMGRCL